MPNAPRLTRDPPPPQLPPIASAPSRRGRRRLWIFLPVFLLGAAVVLGYHFLRAPLYETSALVKLGVPAHGVENHPDLPRHEFLTQVQMLLGRPVLEQVMLNLGGDPNVIAYGDPVAGLADMLRVVPVEGTELVEIRARGSNPHALPVVVNTLIDVYTDRHRDRREDRGADSEAALERQLQDLEARITTQRAAIRGFQDRHDITSLQADNNRVLARLSGMHAALDEAEQAEREARAQLRSVQGSVGEGQPILTEADRQAVAGADREIADIEAELDAMAAIYTRRYMALDPKVRDLRERLSDLRERREALYRRAQDSALAGARQDLDRARDHLRRLREDQGTFETRVRVFEARFEELEGRKQELVQLEELYRDTRERSVQLGLAKATDAARVEVVERAGSPRRIPDANLSRDALLGIGGALLLALFAVLLFEFLSPAPPSLHPVGVGFPHDPPLTSPDWSTHHDRQSLPLHAADAIPHTETLSRGNAPGGRRQHQPSGLDLETLRRLWQHADSEARLVVGLLLSGLSGDELVRLMRQDLDLQRGEIRLQDRTLALPPALIPIVVGRHPVPPEAPLLADHRGRPLDPEDLDALIVCVATDAGLEHPTGFDTECLRRTYIVYLIESGLRLRDLPRVVGHLPARELAGYAHLSPLQAGLPLDTVDTLHPLLQLDVPGLSSNGAGTG